MSQTLGTAKITFEAGLWIVRWKNVGSELRNAPRTFRCPFAAEAWCLANDLAAVG